MTDRRFVLVPARIEPAPLVQLDEQQRAVVEHRGGALVVVGGPGTGRTTTLVASVLARCGERADLGRHLVLTWSRPAAQALRSELVRRLGRTQLAPQVMTVHGFCHALVRRFASDEEGSVVPGHVKLLTAPEQEFRVRELLRGHDTSDWPDDLLAAAPTRAFAGEVRNVLARMRQLGMDPDEVVAAGRQSGRAQWEAVGRFFDDYLDVLDAEGSLDYAEVVHRSRLLLLDDQVRAALSREFDTVHVDDFSECDPSQVRLLADLAGLGLDLVAFADPSTSVFGFRGGDTRAVLDFERWFSFPGRPAARIELLTNHRSARAVVGACAQVASRLPVNGGGPIAQPAPGAKAGRVMVRVYDSPGAQTEHVAQVLRDAHLEGGLEWSEMAVLTRAGRRELPGITRALAAAGVPVEVAGDEIALASEMAVRPLLLGLELALALARGDEQLDPDEVARLLRSPIGGIDSLGLRRLGRQLRRDDEDERPSGVLVAALVRSPEDRSVEADHGDGPSEEYLRAVAVGRLLSSVAGQVGRGASVEAVLWELWNGTSWPDRLRSEALRGGDGAQRAHRDADAVMALFDLAARDAQLAGEKGVRALLAEVAGQQIPEDTARESDLRRRGVRLVTAHRAKGEQWRLVVVMGVQEGIWPNLARRGTLLEADRLSLDGLQAPTPTSATLADERRLFHLACSRAVEQLVVTAVNGVEGEGDQPSRFLTDLGVEVVEVPGRATRPTTVPALVAELRRVATDAQQAPALREAAAARLARLADEVDADGEPLAPGADPANWWGVLEATESAAVLFDPDEPVVLQSSQVQGLLECPRQWFLSRQVRAESARTSAASLGTVVHLLAQHALTDGIDPEQLSDHLDSVWDRMDFDAQWMSSSERLEAQQAIERFSAWTQATDDRQVLGVEVPFRTSVAVTRPDGVDDQVVVVGSVDRLERDGEGRLRVVDFKTGRNAPTHQQVGAMDQIGIYQLAAQAGAFDPLAPGERRVGGAELVYLRKQDGQLPWPKVLSQASLDEVPHLDPEAEAGQPTWVHQRLGEAAGIVRSQRFDAQRCDRCAYCPFEIGCPAHRGAEEVAP